MSLSLRPLLDLPEESVGDLDLQVCDLFTVMCFDGAKARAAHFRCGDKDVVRKVRDAIEKDKIFEGAFLVWNKDNTARGEFDFVKLETDDLDKVRNLIGPKTLLKGDSINQIEKYLNMVREGEIGLRLLAKSETVPKTFDAGGKTSKGDKEASSSKSPRRSSKTRERSSSRKERSSSKTRGRASSKSAKGGGRTKMSDEERKKKRQERRAARKAAREKGGSSRSSRSSSKTRSRSSRR